MMTMLLPIPAKKSIFYFFFIYYNIQDGYINKKVDLNMHDTDDFS